MFEKLNIFFMYQKYILVDFVLIFAGYSRNVFLGPLDELDWARKYISMVSGVELLKPIGIRKWVDPIGLGWDYVFSIFFLHLIILHWDSNMIIFLCLIQFLTIVSGFFSLRLYLIK